MTTILWIGLTVIAYIVAYRLDRQFRSGLLSPMFIGSAIVMVLLLATHTDSKTYAPTRESIDELLGPAMIALAVPLYNNRKTLSCHLRTIAISLLLGSVSTMVVAIWFAQAFGLSQSVAEAIGLKSVTAPVAITIATQLGANTGIAALAVFLTARIGDLAGPAILSLGRVVHPFARGLAMGCISTAGGVARISKEGDLPAAVGGMAVSVTALASSLVAGILVPYLVEFSSVAQHLRPLPAISRGWRNAELTLLGSSADSLLRFRLGPFPTFGDQRTGQSQLWVPRTPSERFRMSS